jgi:hypothetical protein
MGNPAFEPEIRTDSNQKSYEFQRIGMFEYLYHRFALPVLVVAIISTVYVVGWADELHSQMLQQHWPALPVPGRTTPGAPQISSSESVD